jgi:hypothetical protein
MKNRPVGSHGSETSHPYSHNQAVPPYFVEGISFTKLFDEAHKRNLIL